MTHQTVCVALWGGLGSQVLLQRLLDKPLLQRTLERLEQGGRVGAAYTLLPWLPEHDGMARDASAGAWRKRVIRCHPDERIAMRDFVAMQHADIGVLVQGHAADVDVAEVILAGWYVTQTGESYKSHRVAAYKAEDWLRARDSEEWGPIRSLEEMRAFFSYPSLLEDDTRAIRARRG